MAADEVKSGDFYSVLGLKKECSAADLKIAYRRLALKWHPDRCSAAGNSKHLEEAKKKFQEIQEAYSVLSDSNKRFLYDVGVYDCDDDDDENGMGEFLNEMAAMMNQNKSSENRKESFEELQELFEEMFQSDLDAFVSSSGSGSATPSSCSSSSVPSCSDTQIRNAIPSSNKRNSSEMFTNSVKAGNTQFEGGFCMGTGGTSGIREEGGQRRCHRSKIRSRDSGKGRKQ